MRYWVRLPSTSQGSGITGGGYQNGLISRKRGFESHSRYNMQSLYDLLRTQLGFDNVNVKSYRFSHVFYAGL